MTRTLSTTAGSMVRTLLGSVALLAIVLMVKADAVTSNTRMALADFVKNKTLVYRDTAIAREHFIYFGRFGNNFDRHIPCAISEKPVDTPAFGTWQVVEKQTLCLTDGEGDQSTTCLKYVGGSGSLLRMEKADGNGAASGQRFSARLVHGNRLPFG